ncbi:MAG: hypothetical protein JXQ75_01295 [Phycisphaerae bacterium]|nr:hypothetical protein [Phycisphaerae bacterium]
MKARKYLVFIVPAVWLAMAVSASGAPPVMLQYFEAEWDTIRYRMPDVFMAGYDSMWLPPPQKGADGTNSIGYDLFDRFDLGSESSPTRYGTESGFRLMVEEAHKASCLVFVDWIMNHNASKDNWTSGFPEQGGYPGFVLEVDGDDYGDFHEWNPGTECPQSHDPGAGCYDLYYGRLLGLIDIAQEKNHSYIRHPVESDPDNIPGGTLYNNPDPDNYRLYPDTDLPPYTPNNPGTPRNPSPPNYTFYPYNESDLMQGDPVLESATSLLLRSTQYYLEVLKVDGFRLDAAKHIETWFWDNLWDAAVHNRYTGFDGTTQTPYSFVEAVTGNGDMVNWVRKPAGEYGEDGYPSYGWEFGNRDALDLNEAGQLRDLVSWDGGKQWADVVNASVDNVDGYNNGTIGVHHVNSHDNTISEDEDDTVAQAYVLTRTGPCLVYHHAAQFGSTSFPEPNGRDDALGLGSDHITTLVKIRNEYGRGYWMPRNSSPWANVLVYTRQTPGDEDNLLVGLNDSESNGYDTVSVTTAFPSGTRLHEATGNAADATVDPNSDIPELIVVGSGGAVSNMRVPRNRNANGVFHGRGYVMYGPAVPTGTLSITNATTTIAPPDPGGTPDYRQLLAEIVIVTSSTFDIQLQTDHTDPSDPNTDDAAVFRIDKGFVDYNGNGGVDHTDSSSPSYGFENFLTENSPRYGGGSGTYRQTIDAAAIGEGLHYITVQAFRHRSGTADPLFGEFRLVIYVDLEDPDFDLAEPTTTCNNDVTELPVDFVVQAVDATVDSVHIFVDLREDTDFIDLALSGAGEADRYFDTFTLTRSALVSGNHRVDVVAIEELPDGQTKTKHKTYTGIQSTTGTGIGNGDVDNNGVVNGKDIRSFVWLLTGFNPNFGPAADLNCDGVNDMDDTPLFIDELLAE